MDLGLECAGFETVFQVEIDDYASAVLERHWPGVHRLRDVRHANAGNVKPCDMLSLGYPCQNLSTANTTSTRTGLAGEKSGLWMEGLRIVRELSPTVVLVENVARVWREWVPIVRRDLWSVGYASMPIRVRADDLGAPHPRDRVFVVAHADSDGPSVRAIHAEASRLQASSGFDGHWRTPPPGGFRVDDGLSGGACTAQLRVYGNAVMPQMAEMLGRAVMSVVWPGASGVAARAVSGAGCEA